MNKPTNQRIERFYHLETWRVGHSLVLDIYEMTKNFPREEVFGITSQLRRGVSSITANIAEGFGRYHFKDKIRFYYQARGSAFETQNFLFLAKDLKLINLSVFNKLKDKSDQLGRLIVLSLGVKPSPLGDSFKMV